MEPEPNHPGALYGAGATALCFLIFGLGGPGILFGLGILCVIATLWLKGYVRFRRLRRFFPNLFRATVQFVRTRRISKRQVRNLLIGVGIVVVIVILNQLRLAAPGEGRGLSIPTGAFTPDAEFTADGGLLAGGFWTGLLALGLVSTWYRSWAGVPGSTLRVRLYWTLLSIFVILPAGFGVFSAAIDFDDAKTSVKVTTIALKVTLSGMSLALGGVLALAHVMPEPARPPAVQVAPAPPVAVRRA